MDHPPDPPFEDQVRMVGNPRPRTAIATLVCALALTASSRYDDNVLVENGLDVPVVIALHEEPEQSLDEVAPEAFEQVATDPGGNRSLNTRWPEPEPPWHVWPLSTWVDPPCLDDLHIVAHLEDGRTIVRDPPLCPADAWTVTD